jgi:hypothetical protein
MKLFISKFVAVVCVGLVFATVAAPAAAQVNKDDILYLMPSYGGLSSGSDAQIKAEVTALKALGPEGPYVKLGFTVFVGFTMTAFAVNDDAAMDKAIAADTAVIDALITKAKNHGVPIALNILTPTREAYDAAQTASEVEDVRNMQWLSDNSVARGWWSTSRYARKKSSVQEAYVRALGRVLANRMSLNPDVLVAASGDGEVELAFSPNCPGGPTEGDPPGSKCLYADYSPFAIAEFRDWLRNGGLYAGGQEFAGQGYANAHRYAGDLGPQFDTNGDGHTFNLDFGTAFTTWDLLHFNWSIESDCGTGTKPPCAPASTIPLTTYLGPSHVRMPASTAGGFDAPRVYKPIGTNAFWDLWVAFRVAMLQRHNQNFARWITTSVDTATKTTVSPSRWFSYQIAADYLFGSSPAAPNERWYSSMSSLSTADVSPYGSMGITAFNVDFATQPAPCGAESLGVVKTLAKAAPAISARNARWGVSEWHPGQRPECPANQFAGGFSPNLQIYLDEMAVVEQYGPSYLAPFIWDAVGKNQIKGTPFEIALKDLVAKLRNGRDSQPQIKTDVADGATISLPLVFTGSAVDLGKVRGTSHGTGIDLVTLTMTKSGGSVVAPTVTYGLTRSDTTALGAQFAQGGFSATLPKVAEGAYTITITARSTVGAALTTTKTITVTVVYALTSSPATLQFGGTKAGGGGAANTFTQPQAITLQYGGNSTPTYTAAANQPWIQVISGPSVGQFTVGMVNPSNVIGTQTSLSGVVTISGTNPTVAVNVPVVLTVIEAGASQLPFGNFDLPATSTTPVSGSIGVSGWALDDVGIDRVEIWRDRAFEETTPVYNQPGHLGHGKIFVAGKDDVRFIQGARNDIATQFPNNPNAHKAGWGYLMLTQGLFNQGNGTFTLYAFAYDIDGRGTSLGSKTIVVSNATAVKPFGNIDQPANGATLSTADPLVQHWNYGWALTPAGAQCTVPNASGSAGDPLPSPLTGVYVAITGEGVTDSGLRRVRYGDLRTDIQSAFPGLTNTNGAGGAYFIDISTLPSGTLQLGWYVVDDCNRSQGIGSRFINIVKAVGTGTVLTDPPMMLSLGPAGDDPVDVVRSSGETDRIATNSDGVRVVEIPDNERVEVRLPSTGQSGYVGYQIVNGERTTLPLGSSLSSDDGVFYWHPAAGFLGAYNLEFVGDGPEGRTTTRVRVIVGPSMRLTVDTPQPGAVVGASFAIGGWTFDLAGEHGGVDAVDVWAYQVMPGVAVDPRPTYLGSAIYGGSRPDVAASYGSDFTNTAFDLTASGLAPGTYDVVAFARRASTGSFDAAQSVRIVVR